VNDVLAAVLAAIAVLAFVGVNFALLIWAERKIAGHIQRRIGPLRVGGPMGLLQSLADGIKLFAKEDFAPAGRDRWVWALAPLVSMTPAIMVFVALPFGPHLIVHDMNIGLIYITSITSFTLLAIFMAGWGSNNKYSLLGAMRAGAQLFSYEIPAILATIGVVMAAGSLSLQTIVAKQSAHWFLFPQIIGFVIFYIASLAELNRTPFDLAEAESELVAGYMTEYSGMRWAMFPFAEYTNLFTSSALATTLFLGGWHGPAFLPGWVWFAIKTYALVFVAMWIRWTLPRVRMDQLMDLGWKFLIPLGLVNILGTGAYLALVR
jgi:NADH-quinone oxidoreductase subunit H